MNHPQITVTESGCWEWQGGVDANGYGQIALNGQHHLAHRLWYLVHVGRIPAGKMILHSCDNPPCVNPEHLRPGTALDNYLDMVERGRHHDNRKLTDEQEDEIRSVLATAKWGDRKRIAAAWGVSIDTIRSIARRAEGGERLVSKRLTPEQRAEIVAESTGAWGEQVALAKKYGVTQPAISHLLRRSRAR